MAERHPGSDEQLLSEVSQSKITVQNKHGEKLVGLLHYNGSRKLVIVCHGFRSSKDEKIFVSLASALTNQGISVFRFDFAGNGESEGVFRYGNYKREAEDIRSVIFYFLEQNYEISAIIGHSKGGNAVLLYASVYHDVRIVINISGRFALEKGIEGRLGKDFMQRIEQDGFIDVKDKTGKFEYRVTEESLKDRLETDMRAKCLSIDMKCRLHPRAVIPQRKSEGAAGYDLAVNNHYTILAGERLVVSTGIAIAIPEGFYGRIAPKSGISVEKGFLIGAGVIDQDYRGEVKILIFNVSYRDIHLTAGEYVAQLILEKISTPDVVEVSKLPPTSRGTSGFGSTGRFHQYRYTKEEKGKAVMKSYISCDNLAQVSQDINSQDLEAEPDQPLERKMSPESEEWNTLMKVLLPRPLKKDMGIPDLSFDEIFNTHLAEFNEAFYALSSDTDTEWTNPFAEGGGDDDMEFFTATSEDICSDDEEALFVQMDLEEGLELDYPQPRPPQVILASTSSGISQYRPPDDAMMGPPQYPPANQRPQVSNPYCSPDFLNSKIGKSKFGSSTGQWVLPSAQQQSAAMLVLPDDIGLYNDVISRWESITTNVVDSKIWSDLKTKVIFIENLLGEVEKKTFIQWRMAFPEQYDKIVAAADETQNIY